MWVSVLTRTESPWGNDRRRRHGEGLRQVGGSEVRTDRKPFCKTNLTTPRLREDERASTRQVPKDTETVVSVSSGLNEARRRGPGPLVVGHARTLGVESGAGGRWSESRVDGLGSVPSTETVVSVSVGTIPRP